MERRCLVTVIRYQIGSRARLLPEPLHAQPRELLGEVLAGVSGVGLAVPPHPLGDRARDRAASIPAITVGAEGDEGSAGGALAEALVEGLVVRSRSQRARRTPLYCAGGSGSAAPDTAAPVAVPRISQWRLRAASKEFVRDMARWHHGGTMRGKATSERDEALGARGRRR